MTGWQPGRTCGPAAGGRANPHRDGRLRAAVAALGQLQPDRIIVAVPTASPETCEALKAEVDEVVCAITPEPFHAVGYWYEDFTQTTDQEVRELLAHPEEVPATTGPAD